MKIYKVTIEDGEEYTREFFCPSATADFWAIMEVAEILRNEWWDKAKKMGISPEELP